LALAAVVIASIPLLLSLVLPAAAQQPTPTRTPLVYPTHTPYCTNTMPTRLVVHQRGRVSSADPEPMNVREGPNTNTDLLGQIPAGSLFYVLAGPVCSVNYTWYEVIHRRAGSSPLVGWVAEGADDSYYLEPYPPGR
jgi:hypothetical protein